MAVNTLRIPVVHPDWLTDLDESRLLDPHKVFSGFTPRRPWTHTGLKRWLELRPQSPGFRWVPFSVLFEETRDAIREICEKNGARYASDLTRGVTHLLAQALPFDFYLTGCRWAQGRVCIQVGHSDC